MLYLSFIQLKVQLFCLLVVLPVDSDSVVLGDWADGVGGQQDRAAHLVVVRSCNREIE